MKNTYIIFYIFVAIVIFVTIYTCIATDARVYKSEKVKDITQEKKVEDNAMSISCTEDPIEPVYLGEFKLTAYCSCYKCCGKWAYNRPKDENGKEIVYGSIGEKLIAGTSIAVDPSVIPYGSEVVINGKLYIAQDCGGAIKGNRIDVYFDDHDEALKFGVQYANVYMLE